jgi:hypothetical protein
MPLMNVYLFKDYFCSCCITLMKVLPRLLLFVVYVTDEGVLKIIAEGLFKIILVRVVCHWISSYTYYYCMWCIWLMKVYLRLLLFVLYVTDEGLLKIITVRVVCHW